MFWDFPTSCIPQNHAIDLTTFWMKIPVSEQVMFSGWKYSPNSLRHLWSSRTVTLAYIRPWSGEGPSTRWNQIQNLTLMTSQHHFTKSDLIQTLNNLRFSLTQDKKKSLMSSHALNCSHSPYLYDNCVFYDNVNLNCILSS